jgi:hypothetical protein
MIHEVVEEILDYHTLEYIIAALDLTDHEVLQALLDAGTIQLGDLDEILFSYIEEEDSET